ncbi:MAG: hypothetical protein A2X02_01015 [Bacteroidetes bacterium GWF2_29_10]|nr:MAG: hypothetical protein A2X02_01015 [Bacteroidetes bacterium GWF2_29_10]
MIKYVNMAINIILLIAVVILYYFYFTNSNTALSSSTKSILSNNKGNIVFINTDSLWEKYEYVNELKTKLETKKQSLEKNIQNKITLFQSKVDRYKYQASTGQITMESAQQKEQELMIEQQKILSLKDSLENEFLKEETKLNTIIQDSIINFIKRNSKDYNFVFGYSKGSSLLFASDSFEMTNEVIKGLNNEYQNKLSK